MKFQTTEDSETEFRRQIYLNQGLGKERMIAIIEEQFSQQQYIVETRKFQQGVIKP